MNLTDDELTYQASIVPPIVPEGRALAAVIVTVVCLVASYVLVGLRTWCRAIWLSNVWGLDDTLAVLGLVCRCLLLPTCDPPPPKRWSFD